MLARTLKRVANKIIDNKFVSRWWTPRRFLEVQTDLTNYCNLKCRMCYFSMEKGYERNTLSFESFEQLFGGFADRIKMLGLSCATEPLLARKKDLFKILDFVKENRIPKSCIVTNATMLSKPIAEKLVEASISTVQVSIDSHIKSKYENIRIGANFDRVVRNVKYLIDYRNRVGASNPKVQINCVLMKDTLEDVPGYLDFVYELGVDIVDIRHLVVHAGCEIEDQLLFKHRALTNLYFDYIRKRCRKLKLYLHHIPENFSESTFTREEIEEAKGVTLPSPSEKVSLISTMGEGPLEALPKNEEPHDRLDKAEPIPSKSKEPSEERGMPPEPSPSQEFDQPLDDSELHADRPSPEESKPTELPAPDPSGRRCLIPLGFMQVRPDGNVLPCCCWYGEEPIGNIVEAGFEALWNRKDYVEFRQQVSKGIFTRDCCRNCPELGSGLVDNKSGFEEKGQV